MSYTLKRESDTPFPQGAGMKEVVKERNLVYTGAAYYENWPGTLTHRRSQFFNFGVRKYRSDPHDFLLAWTRNMPSEVSYFQSFSWFMFPFCCQPSSQTSKKSPYHPYLKAFSSSQSYTSPSAGHGTQPLPVKCKCICNLETGPTKCLIFQWEQTGLKQQQQQQTYVCQSPSLWWHVFGVCG